MSEEKYQVAIIGGGITGATVACLLAEKGISVALVDAGDPSAEWPQESYDLRVSALTLASINVFKSLGVWDEIVQLGEQPIEKMYVWDHFGSGELAIDSAEAGEMQMGAVVENRITVLALWKKLQLLKSCDGFKLMKLMSFELNEDGVAIHF